MKRKSEAGSGMILVVLGVCLGMMVISGLSIWIGKGYQARKAERARVMDQKAYGHLNKRPFVAQKKGYRVAY